MNVVLVDYAIMRIKVAVSSKASFFLSLSLGLLWAPLRAPNGNTQPRKRLMLPHTYFARTFKDPYRWLENLQDPEVAAWFKAQADLAEQVLYSLSGVGNSSLKC